MLQNRATLFCLGFILTLTTVAVAQWSPFGTTHQAVSYTASVQQPINADNSSTFAAKKGVIPVKFTLASGMGDLTIVSTNDGVGYGGVSFTLPSNVTLNNMGYLGFTGTITGCGAGSPRFTLDYGSGKYMYVYLGGETAGDPNSACQNGAGINLLSSTTATRFEATLLGNPVQYDTVENIKALYGDLPIQGMWFVTDNGNSQVTLHSVNVGTSTFTFASGSTPTCNLPPATIDVQNFSGTTPLTVDESVYVAPADNGGNFRIDGCQYIYNLNAKMLGAGNYKVFINVDGGGDLLTTPGSFSLK